MFDAKEFWNAYEEGGIVAAYEYSTEAVGPDGVIAEHVPALIEEAKEREVDMIKFLSELDEVENDAIRADHDGRGVSPDSSGEADLHEDEDVAAPASDADGEDRSEDEGGTAG